MDFKATLLDSDILSVHLVCFASLMCHVKRKNKNKMLGKKNRIDANAHSHSTVRDVYYFREIRIFIVIACAMAVATDSRKHILTNAIRRLSCILFQLFQFDLIVRRYEMHFE